MDLAKEFTQQGADFENIFTDEVNLVVLNSLERLSKKLQDHGVPHRACSARSILALRQQPEERKKKMIADFQQLEQWITTEHVRSERSFLTHVCDHFDLEPDERFWKDLEGGSIVEIYNLESVQVYRSLKLLELTAYSILDLSSFEWYVLYKRPKIIVELMMQAVNQFVEDDLSFMPSTVPKHLLVEALNTGMTDPFIPNALEVEFQNFGMLKKKSPSFDPRLFMCTAKAKLVAEDFAEVSQLDFL